jgi:four helix bundle protein
MRDFTKLEIWQRSHQLTVKIYLLSKSFPKDEMFGLTSQMRRSASSVPTNIAEGCGRSTNPQTRNFFDIALGSLSELQYQIMLCKDLNFIPESFAAELLAEANEIRRMIYAYIQKLK